MLRRMAICGVTFSSLVTTTSTFRSTEQHLVCVRAHDHLDKSIYYKERSEDNKALGDELSSQLYTTNSIDGSARALIYK
jgi:hypothetical protein